jgi:hypothetical protein
MVVVSGAPAASSSAARTGAFLEGQEEDETVPIVPLVGDGWIEFAPAPEYQSENQWVTTTTKLDKVEAYACAVFKFNADGNIASCPGEQPKGVYRVVADTQLPQGLPGGAQLRCKEFRKIVLQIELGGGVVEGMGAKRRLKMISLKLRNFDAESWSECVVQGHTIRTDGESNDGSRAKWWDSNLRDWPLENGYSEVVGSYQYTLRLVERKK